jgi:NAD-dependent deacetylase
MDRRLRKIVETFATGDQKLAFLTGAGISAESGIPTFRGIEGFWTVGSRNYHPQEMATRRMFLRKPLEVWAWYLYRLGLCATASPNAGHEALVEIERMLGDRFVLITQNVDNLHIAAGNSPERTYRIHGDICGMRCSKECCDAVYPLPAEIKPKKKGESLTGRDVELLRCPACKAMARPHVLWFDEFYNEEHYRFRSCLQAASETGLLVIAGTSGSTTLPCLVAKEVFRRARPIIDINVEENPFSVLAESGGGLFLKETCTTGLKKISGILKRCF